MIAMRVICSNSNKSILNYLLETDLDFIYSKMPTIREHLWFSFTNNIAFNLFSDIIVPYIMDQSLHQFK